MTIKEKPRIVHGENNVRFNLLRRQRYAENSLEIKRNSLAYYAKNKEIINLQQIEGNKDKINLLRKQASNAKRRTEINSCAKSYNARNKDRINLRRRKLDAKKRTETRKKPKLIAINRTVNEKGGVLLATVDSRDWKYSAVYGSTIDSPENHEVVGKEQLVDYLLYQHQVY